MGKRGPHRKMLEFANFEKGDFDHSDLSHLEHRRHRSSPQPPDFSSPIHNNNASLLDYNLIFYNVLQHLHQVFYDMPEPRYSLCTIRLQF